MWFDGIPDFNSYFMVHDMDMFYWAHFKISYLFTPKSGQKSEIIKICKIKKIHFAKSWKQLVPFERAA